MGGVTTFRARADNMHLLVGILVILSWPWIFLATIWKRDGIRMEDYIAEFESHCPHFNLTFGCQSHSFNHIFTIPLLLFSYILAAESSAGRRVIKHETSRIADPTINILMSRVLYNYAITQPRISSRTLGVSLS